MRSLELLRSRFITRTPLVLSHLVTSLCNARCKICDLWKKSTEYKGDLSKDNIIDMLEEARKAGITDYVLWGGEPLLRRDLPEILKVSKAYGFSTTIITNGFLLREKYKDIIPYTDNLVVSIDADDSLHDEMRGLKGVLGRAIEGIELFKGTKTRILINSVISNMNLNKIDGLMELSKRLNVPITFEPIMLNESNKPLIPTDEELKAVISKIVSYKKSGYRVFNSFQYLNILLEDKKYVCHFPKIFITVDAHGNISSCLNKNWGNVKEDAFRDVFKSREFKSFCRETEKCNQCIASCPIESSLVYEFNPFVTLQKIRSL